MGLPAILQQLLYQGQSQGLGGQTASFPWPQSTIDQIPTPSIAYTPGIQGAEAQGANPQVPQYTDPAVRYPSDVHVRHAQDILAQAMGQHQAPGPMPQPVNPAYRGGDILPLLGLGLGSLLFKGPDQTAFLGNALQGYAGEKQHIADQKTQVQGQQYARNEQERQLGEQRNIQIAQQGLNNENANYSREYQSALNQENQQAKEEQRYQQAYNQLSVQFRNAKSKKEMEQIAPQLIQLGQRLGLPMQPITPADIQQAWLERSGQEINRIEDNWRQTVDKAVGRYGAIDDPQTIKYLNGERARLQSELRSYNPELQLSDPPTEKSLTQLKQEEYLKLAKDKYGLQRDLNTERIAAMKANIARQEERIAIARTNAARGEFAANTGRMNAELAQAKFEYVKFLKNQLGDSKAKDTTGLRAKAAGLQAKVDGYNKAGNDKAAATAKVSLDSINAQIKFYEDELKNESLGTDQGQKSVAKGGSYGGSIFKTAKGNSYTFVRD